MARLPGMVDDVTLIVVLDKGRLPVDMLLWLNDNVGPIINEADHILVAEGENWFARMVNRNMFTSTNIITFRFYQASHALLFKLTWAGS